MYKVASGLILLYFSLGAMLLPMGNFALLPQLPQMYEHCKTHEHPDMNAWEFVTDHLVNVDGVFDSHSDGDEQKPHAPVLNDNFFQQVNFYANTISVDVTPTHFESVSWIRCEENYNGNYLAFVFHPPIV